MTIKMTARELYVKAVKEVSLDLVDANIDKIYINLNEDEMYIKDILDNIKSKTNHLRDIMDMGHRY